MLVFDIYDRSSHAKLDETIAQLERLICDLKFIRANGHPTYRVLFDAPILNEWTPSIRVAPCLTGLSSGHPKLRGNDRPILTSEAWVVAPEDRWVRTLNRYYRLGKPSDGGPDQ